MHRYAQDYAIGIGMLTRAERRAVAALALQHGASGPEAARAAQVHHTTVYRWLEDPEYTALMEAASIVATRRVIGILTEGAADAASYLVSAVRNEDLNAGHRIRAADLILTHLEESTPTGVLIDATDQLVDELHTVRGEIVEGVFEDEDTAEGDREE